MFYYGGLMMVGLSSENSKFALPCHLDRKIMRGNYARSFYQYLNEHGVIDEQFGRKIKFNKRTGCKICEQVAMKVWSC